MAPTKDQSVSFDAIIQRGRDQQKREALANEILGSGRRKSAPGTAALNNNYNNRKAAPAAGGSLASRMGVTKRSSSAIPKPSINNTRWGHDLHHVNNPRASRFPQLPRTQSASRLERGNRLYQELRQEPSSNGPHNPTTQTKGASGINIRGAAQPTGWTVVASNFAPGTTAADIEAVMTPIGGEMLGCRLTSSHPTVIAEMQFTEKSGADNVITMFNNRKADGRLLYVFMKESGPSPVMPGQRSGHQPQKATEDRDGMDVDKDDIDRREPDRSIRRAEPEYQEGRYGFPDNSGRDNYRRDDRWDNRRSEGRLYSDNMRRNDRGYRR
ncbi:hypothetical protein SLS55_001231 [Diplodia seriata]|uniref:Putative nucleotide-binding alpha-beta plait n=2 Tax=Diplodia seriata TaxID=420778 RepID=A0A0G2GC75_9PEZI|nr:putative nucleotide-binding alpha-beta plait [Diplodia seriata]